MKAKDCGASSAAEDLTVRSRERTIRRAFHAANLLTADPEQAERAIVEAIGLWNPSADPKGRQIFGHALTVAVRRRQDRVSSETDEVTPRRPPLPDSVQAVIGLSPELRHCYVLRILIGLSSRVCARLLDLDVRRLDENTCEALRSLPSVIARSNKAIEFRG
jgi:hypothetical protein